MSCDTISKLFFLDVITLQTNKKAIFKVKKRLSNNFQLRLKKNFVHCTAKNQTEKVKLVVNSSLYSK